MPAAMASSHGACRLAMLLLGLLLAASGAESSVILVGGNTGWTTGFDYDSWMIAQNIQLRVGDNLVFTNPDSITHTVGMLNTSDDYQTCNLGGVYNVTPVLQGSNISIVIPGTLEGLTLYVVCTIPGHCTDNQKIKGLVSAAETTPPGTPSDADMNRIICWTTAILLIAACFWNLG